MKYFWTMEVESLTIGLTHYVPVTDAPPGLSLDKFVANNCRTSART